MARLPRFEVPELIAVMGEPVTSASVVELLGADLERIARDEFWGSLSYGDEGVEIGFREAWVLFNLEPSVDNRQLHLSSVFLHSDGYSGYCEYRGDLPGGVRFGDTAETVMRKLGEPTKRGGGDRIPVLGIAPPWIQYARSDHAMHFQFGRDSGLELVTLGCAKPPERPQ